MSCAYSDCEFESYESNDKCIFHCSKDDWFTPKRKIWINKKVDYFWEEIRNKRKQIKNQFIGFVFPRFQNYTCDFIRTDQALHQTHDAACINTSNFGLSKRHHYFYAYIENASFEKAIFLDDADFSKIALMRSIDFTGTVFKKKIFFPSNNLSRLRFYQATFAIESDFSNMTLSDCNFVLATFKGKAEFSQSTISPNVDFSESQYEGDLIYTDATIYNALFHKITVKGEALFDVDCIKSDTDFSESTFEKEFTLSNVDVAGSVNFSKATFKKEADFQNGTFGGGADFSEVKFGKDAIFTQRTFAGNADFSKKVIFKGDAFFDVDGIKGYADFSESTFEKEFGLMNVDVTGDVNFSKATFKKDADFQNGTFYGEADFSEVEFGKNAIFTQRIFEGNADFKNIKVQDKADFTNNTFNSYSKFNLAEFESNVIFTQCDFAASVFFREINVKGQALFDIDKIEGSANYSGSTFEEEFIFTDVEVIGEVNFKKVIFKKEANFQNGTFTEDADFSKCTFIGETLFINSVFKQNSKFNDVNSYYLNFTDVQFLENDNLGDSNYKLEFINGEYGVVTLQNTQIGQDLTSKESTFKTIDFNHCTIKENAEVEFRNIEIDNLIFNKYVNESKKVLFDFITVNKILEIKHISFDKERFNHFDISKANVEIENSAFNNNFFNSVKWGTISEKRYKATRDIFRQLKFYSEQQKNFIDADGFYSLEMKEQKKELHKERKELKTLWEKISHFFTNSLVFYLHEKTSDFSQNWWLPIFWLFIVGVSGVIFQNVEKIDLTSLLPVILSFIVFVFILPIAYKNIMDKERIPKMMIYILISLPFIWVYLQISDDRLDDIARILNPTNIFKKVNVSDTHEFLSLLYKILVLFLVYQVITAIKKKVRSK